MPLYEIPFSTLYYQVGEKATFLVKDHLRHLYDEDFTDEDLNSIILATRSMITKYVNARYGGLVKTEINPKLFVEFLTVTIISIIIKWLCDDAWTYDFCQAMRYPQKRVAALERDILITFNHNIFRFMPIRHRDDFIKGTQVIPDPVTPIVTPKHLAPIPIPEPVKITRKMVDDEVIDVILNNQAPDDGDHSVPWKCLCSYCEGILAATGYNVNTLPPYPVMEVDEFWNHCDHVLLWAKQFAPDDYKGRTLPVIRWYRMFKANPKRWGEFKQSFSTVRGQLQANISKTDYAPYINAAKHLISLIPE